MKAESIARQLGLRPVTERASLDREVSGGYAGDLLSDVLANSRNGDLWITLQTHLNIVAVASMKELAGVVIVNGRRPEEETVLKAEQEGIPILLTDLPAFEVVGRLYALGLKGTK